MMQEHRHQSGHALSKCKATCVHLLDLLRDNTLTPRKKHHKTAPGARMETRSTLGIMIQGNVISSMCFGGPAFNSKLLEKNDAIVGIDGVSVNEDSIYEHLLGSDIPGSRVTLTVIKHVTRQRVDVELSRMSAEEDDVFAERQRLFERFTELMDVAVRQNKDSELELIKETIDSFTKMWVEDAKRQEILERQCSFHEKLRDGIEWMEKEIMCVHEEQTSQLQVCLEHVATSEWLMADAVCQAAGATNTIEECAGSALASTEALSNSLVICQDLVRQVHQLRCEKEHLKRALAQATNKRAEDKSTQSTYVETQRTKWELEEALRERDCANQYNKCLAAEVVRLGRQLHDDEAFAWKKMQMKQALRELRTDIVELAADLWDTQENLSIEHQRQQKCLCDHASAQENMQLKEMLKEATHLHALALEKFQRSEQEYERAQHAIRLYVEREKLQRDEQTSVRALEAKLATADEFSRCTQQRLRNVESLCFRWEAEARLQKTLAVFTAWHLHHKNRKQKRHGAESRVLCKLEHKCAATAWRGWKSRILNQKTLCGSARKVAARWRCILRAAAFRMWKGRVMQNGFKNWAGSLGRSRRKKCCLFWVVESWQTYHARKQMHKSLLHQTRHDMCVRVQKVVLERWQEQVARRKHKHALHVRATGRVHRRLRLNLAFALWTSATALRRGESRWIGHEEAIAKKHSFKACKASMFNAWWGEVRRQRCIAVQMHRLFVVWMLRRIADSFLAWREHVQASNHAQQIQRLLNSERSKREKMKMTFERLLVNEKHLADLSHAARRASHDIRVAGAFHEHCARGQNQQGPADPLSRGCLESQSITRPVCFGENVGHAAEHSSALERVAREAGCRANDIMNLRTSMQQAAQQVLARIHVRKLGYSDNIYEHCIRSLEPSSSSVL